MIVELTEEDIKFKYIIGADGAVGITRSLVDKDIKRRKDEIFIENYNEESVQPISYDIHIEKIISQDNNDNEISYCLESHEAVMIKCIEKISVPKDLIIRVENKNSLFPLLFVKKLHSAS